MYPQPKIRSTRLHINTSMQGQTIEKKIEEILSKKEPIKDGAPLLYTERKEGIRASTNIRTDRFEVAVEAADKVAKSYKARREEAAKPKKDGEPEPIQGKGEPTAETSKPGQK